MRTRRRFTAEFQGEGCAETIQGHGTAAELAAKRELQRPRFGLEA
jgi:hypothetical protein